MSEPPVVLATNVTHFVGRPACRQLVSDGVRLIVHDPEFTEEAAREAFVQDVPGVEPVAAQEPDELVAATVERAGRLDTVVSNDYFPAIRAPLAEADPQDLRDGLEAMVVYPYRLAAAAVAQFRKQEARDGQPTGKILFISSAAPFRGLPNYSMYVIGRGAANVMAETLARELAKENIVVNAMAPNYVKSPSYFPDELLADEEAMAKMTKNIPLGRLGEPEEAAYLISFMVSDRSNFITGHVLPFAGGWA
jgi:NAD(P)-dependent dehydrogenase (short-subunit alcohol dehydrogenase family)